MKEVMGIEGSFDGGFLNERLSRTEILNKKKCILCLIWQNLVGTFYISSR